MLRVSSRLLRSARSFGSPLLHDAAAASGARIAAEVSPVEQPNANHALLWRRTSQRSLSSAAKAPAAVVCACLLERLPIVMPPQPAWETEYQEWRYEKLRSSFKEYPKELIEPKAVEDNENKTAWEPATLAQAPVQLRSAERKPQDFLYLVVRKASGQWQFPQAVHNPGETVRQVAERALAQTATGLDVHFLGNAPAAHLALAKETVFFMRASYLGGSPRPASSGAFTDWAWVTKSELPEYVGKDMHALVEQAV